LKESWRLGIFVKSMGLLRKLNFTLSKYRFGNGMRVMVGDWDVSTVRKKGFERGTSISTTNNHLFVLTQLIK